MPTISDIKAVQDFKSLIKYLRTHLEWPVDEDDVDDLTFDYSPDELGLDEHAAVKIREIKQLRPLTDDQPWGIFWINFEPKKLPVVVMRRILGALAAKKRGSKNDRRAAWDLNDLMFISATGEGEERGISFAHFQQEAGDLPTLRVLGWDGADTVLKLDHTAATLQEQLRWPVDPQDSETWRQQWSGIFRHRLGHVIRTADALADRLAQLARGIRDASLTLMEHESNHGPLHRLYKAFQTALIHDLTEADFADTYAQTITYGLLTAAISRTDRAAGTLGTALIAENLTDMVPVTNPFLREMLQTFLKVGGNEGGINFDELGVQDVVELLRGEETDLPAILRDFGNKTQGEDPVIHFYEHFLSAYNKKLKVQRGVFYTPQPVVSYIVRNVHELLQTEFGLDDGLADTTTWGEMAQRNPDLKIPEGVASDSPFVQILDPATGTATFLVEVIDVIFNTLSAKWKQQRVSPAQQKAAWNDYVPKHLLPRLYGYELMMAPYAIAHMKIGLKLYETGYRFGSGERVRIYLTNSLEEPSPLAEQSAASLFEALGHEAQAVNNVKRDGRFTVVMGNPPYSGHSANASKNADGSWNFIGSLLQDYYFVDGKPLGEKNPKWLQDDYVKFLCFGQRLINQTGTGVLSMITNHGYLDNPTFRGMRQNLIQSFSQICVLDLHGNAKKKEIAPDGLKDENVFDIQQGVSICILAKYWQSNEELPNVFHSDLYGDRDNKYKRLVNLYLDLSSKNWQTLNPIQPYYLFNERNTNYRDEYISEASITEIMPKFANGLFTARDSLNIHFTRDSAINTIRDFALIEVEEARQKYKLGKDVRDWKVSFAQKDARSSGLDRKYVKRILYRPFDYRFTYYTGHSRGLHCMPRPEIMSHMIAGMNMALNIGRAGQNIDIHTVWDLIFCTDSLTDLNLYRRGGNIVIPLYLYENSQQIKQHSFFEIIGENDKHRPNIDPKFIEMLEKKLGVIFLNDSKGDLINSIGPEDFFYYIYSILFSVSYRLRYAEFLKIDYPRLPLTSNLNLFCSLCALGEELVALHLLKEPVLNTSITAFSGNGDALVQKGYPKYKENVVSINADQGFHGVSQDVWEFHIGGYQVCHKWLKDRRGRQLSEEDISHYQKIVVALQETIRLMGEIDEVIEEHGGWPIQ